VGGGDVGRAVGGTGVAVGYGVGGTAVAVGCEVGGTAVADGRCVGGIAGGPESGLLVGVLVAVENESGKMNVGLVTGVRVAGIFV